VLEEFFEAVWFYLCPDYWHQQLLFVYFFSISLVFFFCIAIVEGVFFLTALFLGGFASFVW
jgi:hypothetical protein